MTEPRAVSVERHLTLHWCGPIPGRPPDGGDVMVRVRADGVSTGAHPMLVVRTRLITRGECTWDCSPPCRRFRVTFVRIDKTTVPDDARRIQVTQGRPEGTR